MDSNRQISASYAFKKESKGERHGIWEGKLKLMNAFNVDLSYLGSQFQMADALIMLVDKEIVLFFYRSFVHENLKNT